MKIVNYKKHSRRTIILAIAPIIGCKEEDFAVRIGIAL